MNVLDNLLMSGSEMVEVEGDRLQEALERLLHRAEDRRTFLSFAFDCPVKRFDRISFKTEGGKKYVILSTDYDRVGEREGFYADGSNVFQTFASIRGTLK